MRRSELLYDLPAELIAQHAVEPRDAARLLVLDRASGRIEHRVFRDIGDYLRPGDLLVLNDTRVLPARFFARRASGGRVEGLFLHEVAGLWRTLLRPAGRLRAGERIVFERPTDPPAALVLMERGDRGEWLVRPDPPAEPAALLAHVGETPLPPYIARPDHPTPADAQRYQTVYAARAGAVAAPTAGLHFTPELLDSLRAAGIRTAFVTLHVGMGTFAPIDVEDLADHAMHAEWFEAPAAALAAVDATRTAGGRVTAVGTTSVRVLESAARVRADGPAGTLPGSVAADGGVSGWTNVFIYPPCEFRLVDALLTNFHLPGSTLLALVMALAGIERIRAAYAAAIAERYRFYSFGDAMLIM